MHEANACVDSPAQRLGLATPRLPHRLEALTARANPADPVPTFPGNHKGNWCHALGGIGLQSRTSRIQHSGARPPNARECARRAACASPCLATTSGSRRLGMSHLAATRGAVVQNGQLTIIVLPLREDANSRLLRCRSGQNPHHGNCILPRQQTAVWPDLDRQAGTFLTPSARMGRTIGDKGRRIEKVNRRQRADRLSDQRAGAIVRQPPGLTVRRASALVRWGALDETAPSPQPSPGGRGDLSMKARIRRRTAGASRAAPRRKSSIGVLSPRLIGHG